METKALRHFVPYEKECKAIMGNVSTLAGAKEEQVRKGSHGLGDWVLGSPLASWRSPLSDP